MTKRDDEEHFLKLSVQALSERDKQVNEYIAKFQQRNEYNYPAIPSDIMEHFQLDHDQVMYTLSKLESCGYIEIIMRRGVIRAIVPIGIY